MPGARKMNSPSRLRSSEADDKAWLITWLLCFFLGGLGMDRFYNGRTWLGLGKLLTLGGFGFWAIIDCILLLMGKYQNAQGNYLKRPQGRYMILQVIGILGVSVGGLGMVISIVSIVGLIVAIGNLDLEKLSSEMSGMESAMAASPADAWSGFQRAARENDHSAAFAYLTPESQDMVISMTIMGIAMKKAFAGANAGPDAEEERMKAVFEKYSISTDSGTSMDDQLSGVPDKSQLFEELMDASSDGSGDDEMDFGLPSGALTEVTITGDKATGTIDGEMLAFKRVAGAWLVDLQGAMEAAMEAGFESGDIEIDWGGESPTRSSRQRRSRIAPTSLKELEAQIQQKPSDPAVWYELAAKRATYGAWAEAEEDLRQALELNAEQRAANPDQPDLKVSVLEDSRFRLLLSENPQLRQSISGGTELAGVPGALKANRPGGGTPEQRMECQKRLRQIGLNLRVWAKANGGQFPFNVPAKRGGTLDYCDRAADGFDTNSYRHFQPMLQASFTPKELVCPADRSKTPAEFYWRQLELTNVTYLVRSGAALTPNTSDKVIIRCPIPGVTVLCDGQVKAEQHDAE
jgi:TM2 domain-containing membrane protein YozV